MLFIKNIALIIFFGGITSGLCGNEKKVRFEIIDKLNSYQAGKTGCIEVKIVNNTSNGIMYNKYYLYSYLKQVRIETKEHNGVISFKILGGDNWFPPLKLSSPAIKMNPITGKTEHTRIPYKVQYVTLKPKESFNWKYSFKIPVNYPLGETEVFFKFIYKTGEASTSCKVNIVAKTKPVRSKNSSDDKIEGKKPSASNDTTDEKATPEADKK